MAFADESVVSVDDTKLLPRRIFGDADSHAVEIMGCSNPDLPEDIWHHIHSLLPMRDAARVACQSRPFLRSWRCHPVLTFSRNTLGSNTNAHPEDFICKIDHILSNHSGIGIKIFKLQLPGIFDACPYLDTWLQIAVKPGIEELTLELCADLGILKNLTRLSLYKVCISGEELECILSNSLALEQLYLKECKEIFYLKIPGVMQKLRCLKISCCYYLRVIESKAQNLSIFYLNGSWTENLSLGETLQMKNFGMHRSDLVCYARTELPARMPRLKTLAISSSYELRQMPEHHHGCLKIVKITGFSSAKGLVELTCYILKNAESLERLTLDTLCGTNRCYLGDSTVINCDVMSEGILREAPRAVAAIGTHIKDKVPTTVKLTVLEPCSRCHANGGYPFYSLERAVWMQEQHEDGDEVAHGPSLLLQERTSIHPC
ncbi:hypothetical protein PR202_gb29006 [Eleusine coracana subsp. coracana]|uniref:FBD domain-containing protein n=1 Tax=Eleusine coracana subsp. coracana TaxID=191504 RepID=A0AAV5FYA9_ELECO|nr:hypothetical protein PR202_gb29006 [Eleusine coracana subsp. coracana]